MNQPRRDNRLVSSGSAYLRSAAHQPIDWHAWGPEPFALARAGDRPVLLDIGAVWCHWCHIMDRDERPDVDARYQRAVQMLTQQGGWPLTAFLTPEGEVFYGGTYFPPDGKYGRPGFRTVLESVLEAWRERRGQVSAQALAIRRVLEEGLDEGSGGELSPAILDRAVDTMLRMFDPVHGGFGRSPKFPHPAGLALLLARLRDDGRAEIRTVIERTLDGMAGGGIRPGLTYGSTDDLGFHIAENPVHVHDLQATILHCLGFDHERLTFHHQGRDYRLTDVHGKVVGDILA